MNLSWSFIKLKDGHTTEGWCHPDKNPGAPPWWTVNNGTSARTQWQQPQWFYWEWASIQIKLSWMEQRGEMCGEGYSTPYKDIFTETMFTNLKYFLINLLSTDYKWSLTLIYKSMGVPSPPLQPTMGPYFGKHTVCINKRQIHFDPVWIVPWFTHNVCQFKRQLQVKKVTVFCKQRLV